jgi:hypothetical protein
VFSSPPLRKWPTDQRRCAKPGDSRSQRPPGRHRQRRQNPNPSPAREREGPSPYSRSSRPGRGAQEGLEPERPSFAHTGGPASITLSKALICSLAGKPPQPPRGSVLLPLIRRKLAFDGDVLRGTDDPSDLGHRCGTGQRKGEHPLPPRSSMQRPAIRPHRPHQIGSGFWTGVGWKRRPSTR